MATGLTSYSTSEAIALVAARKKIYELATELGRDGYIERLEFVLGCEANPKLDARREVHLSFAPAMWVDVRELVSREIYLHSCYEPELTSFFLRKIIPGSTVIDVGAHYGYFSLVAAQATGPGGKIFSFEPIPDTFQFLSLNTGGISSIESILAAAWFESGQAEISYYGPDLSAFSSFAIARFDPSLYVEEQPITVKTVTLDSFVFERNIMPHLIKIDAENSEAQVIAGLDKTIEKYHPIITVEVGDYADRANSGESSRELLELLVEKGYALFDPGVGEDYVHALKGVGEYKFGNVVAIFPDE